MWRAAVKAVGCVYVCVRVNLPPPTEMTDQHNLPGRTQEST